MLDNTYRKTDTFVIGPFQFRLFEWQEYEAFHDYSNYEITFEDVTVAFQLPLYIFLRFMLSLYLVDLNLPSISLNLFGSICVLLASKYTL